MEDEVRAARPWCHPGFTVRLPCFFPRFFACKTDLVMAWTGALDQRGGGGRLDFILRFSCVKAFTSTHPLTPVPCRITGRGPT